MSLWNILLEVNPFQRFDDWLNSVFSFDERFQSVVDWFLAFPTVIKIPVLLLFLFVIYLGLFSLVKKIIFGLPKKVLFIIVFIAIAYFVLSYFIMKQAYSIMVISLLKDIFKSIIIGVVSIYILNVLGQFINFNIPINIISILLIGFLRLPGLIILLIILLL